MEILRTFSLKRDESIDLILLRNRSLTQDILRTLAESPSADIRGRVLYHQNFTQEIREHLRNDPDESVREYFEKKKGKRFFYSN